MAEERIRIKLKAFDHKLVDKSAQDIAKVARETGAKVRGPIPLPTDRKVWCVIRSPFIDKESMEHFEMRIHKRLIDIINATAETIERLSKLDLPSGVDIEIKL
ncbi:MAG: 30S ribosomal protein S10 [Armatimonadota bacterium]|nr:30S ribosomal protein S10 [Armatimonadota bacterium]MCX7776934.1 30S ribosomal protein S10 [Armatimonadota bacterium]MDW8024767.1 30S ribosomal protein S10 [Armatimonadota bacterium]